MTRKIVAGLLAVGAVWAQNPSAASIANGQRLFEVKACYQCHGWRGQGGLAGARLAQTRLNLQGFRNILRNPPPSNMPTYRAAVLTDQEAADLFAYIQSFPAPEPVEKIPLLKDELKVVTSGAFTAALLELGPEYERATHNELVTEFGPSMGTTQNAIPVRLTRGEAIDVVIMAGPALDDLIKDGKVRAGSRVDLVNAKIGMAVKKGTPKPDISTVDALKRTLLAAKSIGYSDSASGVYLSTELFPKLGVLDQIRGKMRKIEADPVGGVVATGEVEIGFQQMSELLPVKGIDIVAELPPGAQRVTIFAAGIPAGSKHVEAAKALIQWLASPAAYDAIRKTGLEPAEPR